MHDMSTMVGGNLHFDMPGLKKISFEVDGIVAERALRLRLGGLKCAREVLGFIDDAHAAASPTGGGFDDDGIADFAGGFEGFLFTFQFTGTARGDG